MAVAETVLQVIGIIPILMGFADHLGENRLRRLEDAVKYRLTPKGFISLPRQIFKASSLALTWNEALLTVAILLLIGLMVKWSALAELKDTYIDLILWTGSPSRWLGSNAGYIGEILAIPISVLLAVLVGFLLPFVIILMLMTLLILSLLYPLLGLLALANACKKRFGLSGSIVKIASFGLGAAIYFGSLLLKVG